jgi:hypothetical protein
MVVTATVTSVGIVGKTMSQSMMHELCDKCGKSLFMIHPDEQFNCQCPDESHTPLFVFDDEEEVARTSACQLKDLEVGDSFMFKDKKLTKRNNMGWALGVSNVVDVDGNFSHLHPTTYISLIH